MTNSIRNIPPNVNSSLKIVSAGTTDICKYAKKSYNQKYSNVYVQKKIDAFPKDRDRMVEKIIAEFVCINKYAWDTLGYRNTKDYIKPIIDTFPNPDPALTKFIKDNLERIYKELWQVPFDEKDFIEPPPEKKQKKKPSK